MVGREDTASDENPLAQYTVFGHRDIGNKVAGQCRPKQAREKHTLTPKPVKVILNVARTGKMHWSVGMRRAG